MKTNSVNVSDGIGLFFCLVALSTTRVCGDLFSIDTAWI